MSPKKINSALISVYSKDGLAPIVELLDQQNVTIYSTGGTQKFIENLGIKVEAVETLTSYPSILDGRVKTLHPKVFGGILARREEGHLSQLGKFEIPEIDLVIVDLYPFEETVASTNDEAEIIEKIDIGGISLIRAAAKNYKDVVVVPSKNEYDMILKVLMEKQGFTDLDDRKKLALRSFMVSSHYDTAIFNYFNQEESIPVYKESIHQSNILRYGENPHQKGYFHGDLDAIFEKLNGKALSYNNLVDIDAAMNLIHEFGNDVPTFVVMKHTNACGVASRNTVLDAWQAALAGDPISAFGGILISNTTIDLATATDIDKIFYEVLIAPDFTADALALLSKKKKRTLLKIKEFSPTKMMRKSILNGMIVQDGDLISEVANDLKVVTKTSPSDAQINDLLFANKCAKHLKSNTIAIVKDCQLVGMGCGQTSRVDALQQGIAKAKQFELPLQGAVMASDAFFPFPDCVEIADMVGIKAVIQPGGSIKDQLSIDYCNAHDMAMVMTGNRHFKH